MLFLFPQQNCQRFPMHDDARRCWFKAPKQHDAKQRMPAEQCVLLYTEALHMQQYQMGSLNIDCMLTAPGPDIFCQCLL